MRGLLLLDAAMLLCIYLTNRAKLITWKMVWLGACMALLIVMELTAWKIIHGK